MKKNLIFVFLVLIFIVGCSSLDSRGFYLSGEKQGIHKVTETKYDVEGYDQSGYDKNGYNKEGYDRNRFNREGFDSSGFDKSGYNKEGYNQSGYDKNGYNKEGYDKNGFDKEGYNSSGFDKEGYNKEGYDENDFNKHGLNKFTKKKYDKEGFNANGLNAYNMSRSDLLKIKILNDDFKNIKKYLIESDYKKIIDKEKKEYFENLKKMKYNQDLYYQNQELILVLNETKRYSNSYKETTKVINEIYRAEVAAIESEEKFKLAKIYSEANIEKILKIMSENEIITEAEILEEKNNKYLNFLIYVFYNNINFEKFDKVYFLIDDKINLNYEIVQNIQYNTSPLTEVNSTISKILISKFDIDKIINAKKVKIMIENKSSRIESILNEKDLKNLKILSYKYKILLESEK